MNSIFIETLLLKTVSLITEKYFPVLNSLLILIQLFYYRLMSSIRFQHKHLNQEEKKSLKNKEMLLTIRDGRYNLMEKIYIQPLTVFSQKNEKISIFKMLTNTFQSLSSFKWCVCGRK